MRDDDFDFEPVPGLPENLPSGETVLWSGAPQAWRFGHQIFHTRLIAAFFMVIAVSSIFSGLNHGVGAARIAVTFVTLLALGGMVIGFAMVMGWLVAINTIYTITHQRLVIRHGVTLPMSINVPFTKVATAAAKIRADGSGDVSLALLDGNRLSLFAIWPHNRPWSWQGAAPAIRCVSDAEEVSRVLTNAMVAHARAHGEAHARPKVVRTRGREFGTGEAPSPITKHAAA